MKIEVFAAHEGLKQSDLKEKTVVVIDVLRATSTIVTALENGCKNIIPVTEIEEGMKIAANYERDSFLFGGERNNERIEGFHLSNSPLEYEKDKIKDRTIIFTTTNGTKAINRSQEAKQVLIGSLLNANAVSKIIGSFGEDVVIVCAGTHGRFSLEDIVAAGAIIYELENYNKNLEIDDLGFIAKDIYITHKEDIGKLIKMSEHYTSLKESGMEEDVDFCININSCSVVPIYLDGIIKSYEVND